VVVLHHDSARGSNVSWSPFRSRCVINYLKSSSAFSRLSKRVSSILPPAGEVTGVRVRRQRARGIYCTALDDAGREFYMNFNAKGARAKQALPSPHSVSLLLEDLEVF
jgi:hypothetical protein